METQLIHSFLLFLLLGGTFTRFTLHEDGVTECILLVSAKEKIHTTFSLWRRAPSDGSFEAVSAQFSAEQTAILLSPYASALTDFIKIGVKPGTGCSTTAIINLPKPPLSCWVFFVFFFRRNMHTSSWLQADKFVWLSCGQDCRQRIQESPSNIRVRSALIFVMRRSFPRAVETDRWRFSR